MSILQVPRAVRWLLAVLISLVMVIGSQAVHVKADAAEVQWVDGADDSFCLNDDRGRALDALPAEAWCTPIPGCYQDDDGVWVLPSRKTGIWQGDPKKVRYADEVKAEPKPTTPTTSAPKPSTSKPTKKPTTERPTSPKPGTPAPSTDTTTTDAPADLGVDEQEVAVTGAPTAPAAPVLTVKGKDVTVAWQATPDAELESVTGYVVRFTGAQPVTVDATTTTHTFTGLADGSYRAAVRAVNAAGESVSSPPSDPATVGTPVVDVKGTVAVEGELAPGASVTITGTGYAPNVPELALELHSDPVALGTVATDAQGGFTTTVTIPETVPVGAHQVVVLHEGQQVTASPVEVVAAAGATDAATEETAAPVAERVPPHTGLAILAVLALAGIGSLVWHLATGRRRRRASGQTGPDDTVVLPAPVAAQDVAPRPLTPSGVG
ncbi:fibronectin type III domain-containing protein [Aeromicrobium massiliense]|uniref:fibronectin type III domain-containing protein n=1 Tax=Aeromicrobium massiliense TaxID=1464554 RepID=UPI0011CC48FB|nr:hypothetical protein [Aeromicrobium massiliense]